MLYRLLAGCMCLLAAQVSSAQRSPLTDGPYVFLRNDHFLVWSVFNNLPARDSFPYDRKPGYLLKVAVPGEESAFLTVPIKRELIDEPSEFKAPGRVFVLSDIEGTFKGMRQLLQKGGVIDQHFNWTYGNGHLVVCGDLFDRGEEVTACLWLLYKLEEEAIAKGGYVHVILGNHEIMNLSDDTRYVNPKYQQVALLAGQQYNRFYDINTELGRWLRTKNIIEKVGDNLFLHGGVSQAVNEEALTLKKLNRKVKPLYDKDGFDSILAGEKAMTYFSGNTSPFWYRGYFAAPRATGEQVDSTLNLYKVKRIIVGHTLMDSITTFYGGKVIAIDVNHHQGNHQALVIEGNEYYRMFADGRRTKLE